MSVVNASQMLLGDEGYTISRSVRLRSSASAYLNRTPASATNRKTWTWSGWVKRGSLSSQQWLFSCKNGTLTDGITFEAGDTLSFTSDSATGGQRISTAVYRDPSAWYHIVGVYDSSNATVEDRIRIYVNGTRITSFSSTTAVTLNYDGSTNTANEHDLGKRATSTGYFDGYLTEVNFIDGQALTASSFGETDAITGVWKPKKYAGTYGTNGFYLNFSDNSAATAAAIGKDSSGNGNNWTPNNISVTAGATYDSMLDTPTPYADGGNGRGNYCVLNPISSHSLMTIVGGNLNVTSSVGSQSFNAYSSVAVLTGKYYVEATINTGADADMIGVCPSTLYSGSARFDGLAGGVGYYMDGRKFVASTASAYGASYTTGDVIGIALDMDAQTVAFYKNGTSQGTISSSLTAGVSYYFVTGDASNGSGINQSWNFGQRPFSYTPPTGFKALNTQNLPDATIKAGNKYFDVSLWTGNASARSITNAGGFQPDMVWIKSRNYTFSNYLYDSSRGVNQALYSNLTNAETTEASSLTAFNSNGFSLGTLNAVNDVSIPTNFVGWQWKAGGTAVSNTAGSITSQVSANTSAGFSVVTCTTPASGAFTIGHGLGVAPKMIIVKDRANATGWPVYHASVTTQNEYLLLNTTAAKATLSGMFGSALPTSTLFGQTVGAGVNANIGIVAYCFAEVAGYSKFGSYTGNGSTDGPFVYCGFRPKFVLYKNSSIVSDWEILDASRSPSNVIPNVLYPNTSSAEVTSTYFDFTANGFKVRQAGTQQNGSGNTIIFMAFAESPFKNSLAR